MEVDGVLLEQVRAHDHADVGEGEKHLIVLIKSNQRRRDVAVHHADIHDLAGIHVTVDYAAGSTRVAVTVSDMSASPVVEAVNVKL